MKSDAVCMRANLNRPIPSTTVTLAMDDALDVVDNSEIEGVITHGDLTCLQGAGS